VRRLLLIATLIGLGAAGLRGMQLALDTTALGQAVSLGQSSIAGNLTQFHKVYRVPLSKPPFDYLEIVTPFRRIVLAAESQARNGNRRFGVKEAVQVNADTPGHLAVYAELTFHPLNTFVLVPEYDVDLILPTGARVPPLTLERAPRYGPRVEGGLVPYAPGRIQGGAVPGRSQPMLGATVGAVFDGYAIGTRCDRACDLVISENKKELVRAKVALGNLR
jgi:hypothetical protein